MKSNVGTSSFAQAKRSPVGGVFGAAHVGERIGEPNVVSFDMGGTTAKASLVEDGEVDIETDYWIEQTQRDEGYPLKIPVVDIVEIGAGGGSIAWIDEGRSLNVGPRSAGAAPGPACYGRGGTDATVTDAHLLTNRLNPDYFLGGDMTLDTDAARAAMEPIADHFDASVREAAHGVLRIVNSNMSNALKQVSIQRGYDPREFVLVASGGAGALHAPTLGDQLGVKEIVVPRAPGQFSAWGMLMTDPRRDYIRTNVMPFTTDNLPALDETSRELADRAYEEFRADGVPPRTSRWNTASTCALRGKSIRSRRRFPSTRTAR
jgi:N-methylhydantoinase A